jgi:transposase
MHSIVYVDQCGIVHEQTRRRGWAIRGKQVLAFLSGKRVSRTNVMAGIRDNKLIAPLLYEGTTTGDWVEAWFEHSLLPELPTHCVIVMDNAPFHRKKVLEKLAACAGQKIMWLPPYSPDLNKIEKRWANAKNKLRNITLPIRETKRQILEYFGAG